jgi:anti-anti-sigma factor
MLDTIPGWEMQVERGPGWLFVKIPPPDLEWSDYPSLADQIWSLVERHFVYRLALRLDEIDLLNSYLLGQLVVLQRRVREHGGLLRLCGLSPYNQEVLRLHGLGDRLPIYRDVEEAVMGGGSCKPR